MSESHFSNQPFTLREIVLAYKFQVHKDYEAFAQLMESRLIDKSFDIWSLAGDELSSLIAEFGEANTQAQTVENVLSSLKI